jgi:outer membrane protein OmpA-like peptidoglycan-associated protein
MPALRNSLPGLFFALLLPAFAFSQTPRTSPGFAEGIFLDGLLHSYYAPADFQDYLKPEFGFRASLGYELRRFRFSLESGYTRIAGTNPLVLEIETVPLSLKSSYTIPLFWGLGLRPELGLGLLFSRTRHYKTVIAMLLEQEELSRNRGFMAGAGLDLCYTLPGDFITVYAGGGLDLLPEQDGPIVLPLWRAGLSLKPFKLGKKLAALPRRSPPQAAAPESPPVETSIEAPEETPVPELPEPEEGPAGLAVAEAEPPALIVPKTLRVVYTVYFQPYSAVPLSFQPLDEAGALLAAFPESSLSVHGYAAPLASPQGQRRVSRDRALFCRDYLEQRGIPGARISTAWHGVERLPRGSRGARESRRSVELIIEYLPPLLSLPEEKNDEPGEI